MPIWHVPYVWAEAAPLIEKALHRENSGRYAADDVLKEILAGNARLWIAWNPGDKAIDAAIVTKIVAYPRQRDLWIWLVGGRNLRGWVKEGREMVEAYARAEGCTMSVGGMRRGWLRVSDGYKETGVILEKRL